MYNKEFCPVRGRPLFIDKCLLYIAYYFRGANIEHLSIAAKKFKFFFNVNLKMQLKPQFVLKYHDVYPLSSHWRITSTSPPDS